MSLSKHIALGLALLALGGVAHGSQVLRVGSSMQIIAVSVDANAPWRPGDRICVYDDRQELECGQVIKLSKVAAIVKLDAPNDRILRGASVRPEPQGGAVAKAAPPAPEPRPRMRRRESREEEPEELLNPPEEDAYERRQARRPAAKLLNSYESVEAKKSADWNLSGGISAGFTFFFPMIHFQRRLGTYTALGLQPLFFKASASSGSVTGVGGLVTFNYYGNEYFRGFWAQVGVGAHRYSATTETLTGNIEESATSFVAMGTVGWRGYWDLGLNVGVGGGVQFVTDPSFQAADLRGVGIQPVVTLDLGINF